MSLEPSGRRFPLSLEPSGRRLPQFIQFKGRSPEKRASPNAKANAAHPPPSTPPPRNLFQTPQKSCSAATPPTSNTARRRIRGILKTPSYKFTGIRVSPKKTPQPTTPSTVGTNESFDANDSVSRSSSCGSSTIGSIGTFGTTSTEGIETAIEKIINGQTENTTPTNEKKVLRSSSSESVSSSSTSSTSASTFSSNSKEELQRCARIKHIEDLKERIDEAKARKLVERKAYRREDKLILRLARQLKTISKKARENALNITILEESNQFSEECYSQCLQEVEQLRASRKLRQDQLRAEMQTKLDREREQWNRVLRVQNAELEAHKRNHQFNCQALCEDVLHANNDLDRMRTLWEEHVDQKRLQKRGKSRRVSICVAMIVVLVITTFVILSAGNKNSTSSTAVLLEQDDAQLRSLPPLDMIPMGIIRNEDADLEFLAARTVLTEKTIYDEVCGKNGVFPSEAETNTQTCTTDTGREDFVEANSTVETGTTTTKQQQHGERGKRRFNPKQVLAQIFQK